MSRARGLWLLAALAAGCTNLARAAYIEPPAGATRAGLFELRWRRAMIEPSGVDYRPRFRGTPAYDPARDVVYAGSMDHGLYALRGRDGAVIWRFETLGGVDASPTLDGDEVFFGSADGALYAADARTGAMRWRRATAAEVTHAPVVIGDSVYFVTASDTVLGVARGDGAVRWRYRRNAPGGITLSGHAGLARSGGRLYTAFADGTVTCLDARDGSVLWEQDTSADIENIEERNEAHEPIDVDTTPVVIGDAVYVASFSAGVYALDAIGGGQRWRLGDLTGVSGLGTDGRYLYAASNRSGLVKIDPFDGSILWARDLGSRAIVGAMRLPGDLLGVSTADRAFWVVRAIDGEPIDGVAPGRGFNSLPAVASNRLFIESNAGVLYAFRMSWPAAGPSSSP